MLQFYYELEGEAGALPELSGWEAQPKPKPRDYIRMRGFAGDMLNPQRAGLSEKCLCIEAHWPLPRDT